MNESKSATCHRLIWLHEVQSAAIAKGADPGFAREPEMRARLDRAYHAGEPVWMAAEELAFRSKHVTIERRAEREVASLRALTAANRWRPT